MTSFVTSTGVSTPDARRLYDSSSANECSCIFLAEQAFEFESEIVPLRYVARVSRKSYSKQHASLSSVVSQ